MLVISSATTASVRYWQASALQSVWLGNGTALLGLHGRPPGSGVDAHELRDLLAGRHPGGGGAITARPGQRRRQGWDLVFGAPKSVSLLAAAGAEEGTNPVRAAFREAVAATFSLLEQRGAWVYSHGRRERSAGIVAGAFEHMSGGAGQPHLHAHVVLANLAAREDGQWGCLVGSELWRWREGLGACFQLALRAGLAGAGLSLSWDIGPGGLGEVVGVTSEARAVASSRSLATRAGAIWFGIATARTNRVAQGRSRGGEAARSGDPRTTGPNGATAQAARELGRASSGVSLPPPPPHPGAVAEALARRQSSFAEPDVFVALAEACPAGLDARQAAKWALEWCGGAAPGPQREGVTAARAPGRAPGRWTTSLAGHFDRQVTSAEVEGRLAHLGEVTAELAWQELEALGFGGVTARAGAELACSGRALEVLPRAPWLAQAACLDAARAVWQAAGMTVLVASPSSTSEMRWRVLTSLRSPEVGGPGRPTRRVLVVDAADRIGPAGLARLATNAASSGTKLVLVPCGTAPGHGESMAASLDELLERSPLPSLTPVLPSSLPAPVPMFTTVSLPGLAVHGAFTGADAMAQTAASWLERHLSGEQALMVALGPPEAEALNLAARSALRLPGVQGETAFGGRLYAPGELVMALRRVGGTRSGVGAGTRGTVLTAAPGSLEVRWRTPSGPITASVGLEHARDVGYGYATTVPYAAKQDDRGALLLLGDPVALSGRAHVAAEAWLTMAGPGMPAPPPGAPGGRRWQTAVSEMAVGWPDEEILKSVGPRPLDRLRREAWERQVAERALERAYEEALGGRAPARRASVGGLAPDRAGLAGEARRAPQAPGAREPSSAGELRLASRGRGAAMAPRI